MESNPQLQLALDFVQYTDRNIFLTGKAGTGKTTFLHHLKKVCPKRMAVVAPTGVAAINAGGVTIHSFFQMPFGPHVPSSLERQAANRHGDAHHKKFNKEKIKIIRVLDLLVIDEISMVRADTLDGIDEVLRRYRDPGKPFGGVQLLMIGDLHQLSPVVKDEDWRILKDFYPGLYFFNSLALQKSASVCIELTHIYRQKDKHFVEILNRVRENKIDKELLEILNQRYVPDFNPSDDEGYITLTTHNQTAYEINQQKLECISKAVRTFSADIVDDFPEYAYPTSADLQLKEGAQVMFVKNDGSREHLFYNGKIGKVTSLAGETIHVKCPGDEQEIAVEKVEWQNIRYELNAETKEVEERVIGSFFQYPLKLAWAITIHKSQGLTFERAVIDAQSAFAHGQVYVALSRCKSFEGMVLRRPLSYGCIKTDGQVATFTKNANGKVSCSEHLKQAKRSFQQSLIYELFDFKAIKTRFFHCKKAVEDNDAVLAPVLLTVLNEAKGPAEREIYEVADTFSRQLRQLLSESDLPEENQELQARIGKAASYFQGKVEEILFTGLSKAFVETDNKAVKKTVSEALDQLKKEVFIKRSVLSSALKGFSTVEYVRIRANAGIDYTSKPVAVPRQMLSDLNIPNASLYNALKKWRSDLASENNTPVYIVLPQRALIGIVTSLPSSLEELELIKGIGKIKIRSYGREILSMVSDYCRQSGAARKPSAALMGEIPLEKGQKTKVDTKQLSFELYKNGRSLQEIAAERGFSVATIEGHLAHFVGTGELDVYGLVAKNKVKLITEYFESAGSVSLSEAKAALGDSISYWELKVVIKHLEFEGSAVQ